MEIRVAGEGLRTLKTDKALALLQSALGRRGSAPVELLRGREARRAVQQLTNILIFDDALGDDIEMAIRHSLGWWHEVIAPTCTGSESQKHHDEAASLLMPIFLRNPDRVPVRLQALFKIQADLADAATSEALQPVVQAGSVANIDAAVEVARRCVLLSPVSNGTYPPRRPARLSNLGVALRERYARMGSTRDLDEAINVGRESVRLCGPRHPERGMYLSNLGLAVRHRFELTGSPEDAAESITCARAAVAMTSKPAPDRALYLSNLAGTLEAAARTLGSVDDLDEAIALGRNAVAMIPTTNSNRARFLSNLGVALETRFEQTGSGNDLDEAVAVGREAMTVGSIKDPAWPKVLSNLSIALRERFQSRGAVVDLMEAVEFGREAVGCTLLTDLNMAPHQSNFALAVMARFQQFGVMADLKESIKAIQDSLSIAADGDPRRIGYLTNLCMAMQVRYLSTGEPEDLHEAARVGRLALVSAGPGHPARGRCISNLAGALNELFKLTNSERDGDELLRLVHEAVATSTENHPSRAVSLSNLGVALQSLSMNETSSGISNESAEAFRKAALHPFASPLVACSAAASWGRLVSEKDSVVAFERALELLPLVSPRWLAYEDVLGQVALVGRVGRDAAAAFVDAGDPDRALVALEQAQGATYSRVLQSRTDLTDLAAIRPDLAERVSAAVNVLNGSAIARDSSASERHPEAAAQALRDADAALKEVLAEVRQLGEPWTRFFLSPLIEDLLPASIEGPIVALVVAARRCDALVTTAEGVQVVPLSKLTENDATANVSRFLTAIETLSTQTAPQTQEARAKQDLDEVCGWMWDTIIAPVLDHLGYTNSETSPDKNWPRVWWIPTGPLAILPIHAAGHHGPGPRPDTTATVIDRVISSTIPTISTLLRARARRAVATVVTSGGARVKRPSHTGSALLVGMPHTSPDPRLDLPGVTTELATVADRLSATPLVKLVNGREVPAPTKAAVLTQLPQHAWVHLACHAQTDPANPTRSTLLLSDHATSPFSVLDLTATATTGGQLMYLSACTTARPGLRSIDEPVHFAAAALLAGYRHVIATLWPLNDTTGAEVADSIYTDLTHHGRPHPWSADHAATAVHHAIRDQRATPGATIYTWATYTHHGP